MNKNEVNFVKVKRKPFFAFVKRLFDIVASLLGIIVFSIPMLMIAGIVECTSKGPAFFCQRKLGKNKKTFVMLKFRTMSLDAPHDVPTAEFKDAKSYITKVGSFLRKTSLDELPQLFNILMGHMSVIGPRPALEYNEPLLVYLRDANGASSVRPGLTGWAQVNGRDGITMEQKAAFDGVYANNRSLWLDIKIFCSTVVQVFGHKGVVEGGPVYETATAEFQYREIARIEEARGIAEAAAAVAEPETELASLPKSTVEALPYPVPAGTLPMRRKTLRTKSRITGSLRYFASVTDRPLRKP